MNYTIFQVYEVTTHVFQDSGPQGLQGTRKDSISAAKVYKLKGGIQHYGNTVGAEGWKVDLCMGMLGMFFLTWDVVFSQQKKRMFNERQVYHRNLTYCITYSIL